MKQLALIFSCMLLLAYARATRHPAIKASHPVGSVTPFIPDTSINKTLFLNNGGSVYRLFGMIDTLLHDREGAFPEMYVKSKSGTQYLRMIQHFGGEWNSLSEFEFGYTTDLPDSIPAPGSDLPDFFTTSGIRLGMSQAEVIKTKGNKYTQTILNKKERLISYTIKEGEKDNTHFLWRYKMEIYYAHYTCRDGKVTKVKFGFDYF